MCQRVIYLNSKRNNAIQTVCVMIIFALLTFSALMLVVSGIKAYRNMSDFSSDNSQLRASLSYITNKIRTGDSKGNINIINMDGTDVLEISAIYDGEKYKTCLYVYNNVLYEQLISDKDNLSLKDGNFVTRISNLDFAEEKGGLFKIKAETENGEKAETFVDMRSFD